MSFLLCCRYLDPHTIPHIRGSSLDVLTLVFLQYVSYLGHLHRLRDVLHERSILYTGPLALQWSCNAMSGTVMSLFFFGGDSGEGNSSDSSHNEKPASKLFSKERTWTETLIGVNIAVYVAQLATRGRLLEWGAKINYLIAKGQIWRLVTSSFLHVNLVHLMVNCFSLSNIGPAVESFSGGSRYLNVYISSAITSSLMSYWLCKNPSVGASGAIFGLIGANSVFLLRHQEMIRNSDQHLQRMMQVIVINAALGYFLKGIDNWGHFGGFLGGVATSWLLGPAYKLQHVSSDGRKVYADKPPITALIKDSSPTDRPSQ
ncbi:OLC1v1002471C3 [Oldenlandia corymbosa var. corymbosa]|uniref:OLC1v1002471C3 n=1 Tax=Oldenlandia corymbosa var. corymbosa TaxID=529605 RepID=A0AAV1DAJ9_OLDCO|nr:OLC1v1002471C3 [Oldenlandia corymbosa var. corymbosa]